ncbi:MAG: hypothetical protein ACU841_04140 [Gammaproteobacteria bacterium]
MPKVRCKLLYHSESPHLQQLYTGFFLLYKHGLIDLEQHHVPETLIRDGRPQHLKNARHAHLSIVINNVFRLHYDTHDAVEIDEEYLSQCDFYFKRSFSRQYIDSLSCQQEKIHPLGLNYRILPDDFDPFAVQRAFHLNKSPKSLLSSLIDALDVGNLISDNPRLKQWESLPDYEAAPRVLFLVAAYDPYDNPDRSEAKISERVRINDTRAHCIRLLRRELGDKFLGGFNHTPYTVKNYKDVLVASNPMTHKGNYRKIMKSFPICIATTGLHGSIGWKLAEYVSNSKAIVSEKLNYEVTGDFRNGSHYLEFSTPEQCVERSLKLLQDAQLRRELMTNNALYYQSHLKPDTLVLNTLLLALKSVKRPRYVGTDFLNSRLIAT